MNQTMPPDQLMAVSVMGGLCCVLAGIGFVVVAIWMMRNRGQPPAPAAPLAPVPPSAPQPPAADFHLSVLALAFDGYFRAQVEGLVNAPPTTSDPVGSRVELVQRASRALLGVEAQWRHFGYGEKDLGDLTVAQQSYTSAVDDFRRRCNLGSDGGVLAVLTIVLCTRGRRLGVDRLDTRQQVHDLLADRLGLDPSVLLGAEVLWGPPVGGLTENAIRERFPEMHGLSV